MRNFNAAFAMANVCDFVATSTGGSGSAAAAGQRHALIMDEVDGMAGNEDRGGIPVSPFNLLFSITMTSIAI